MAPQNETVTIDTIVAGGDGLARLSDGRVVFVPRTVPGERVTVEIVEERKQWVRARAIEVVSPSPLRREPPCPHYDRCGGCQLQHIDYDEQLALKGRIVVDAFSRLGDTVVDTPEVVRSPAVFGYRSRVTFVLDTGRVAAGFHAWDTPGEVIDIDRCPLADTPINDAWFGLRAGWGPVAERMPNAERLRLTLRSTAGGDVGLAIEGAAENAELRWMVDEVRPLKAVWMLARRGEVMARAGQGYLMETHGGFDVAVEGTAFTQVNRDVAQTMEAFVLDACGSVSGRRVVDGYCGYGLRSLALAKLGAKVTGIDIDRGAILTARRLAKDAGLSASFQAMGVERAIGRLLPVDLVVLNPPRRGVDSRVCRALVKKPPARIIYISCDPATLARDVKRLSAVFDVKNVHAFDLFPQTAHIETLAILERWD